VEDRLAYCTFFDHGGEGEKCVRTIADLTQKALRNAQYTGVDVVSEGVDDRGEISGQDARVDVEEVLEAIHVSAFYKVLSVFQFCQQAVFLSNPADCKVLFHCHKLVTLACHIADLLRNSSESRGNSL